MSQVSFPPNNLDNYQDSLIYLPAAEFAQLLETGRLAREVPKGLVDYGDGLALLDSPENEYWYAFESEPVTALNQFLDNARWIKPAADSKPEIILADPAPLRELILRKLAAERQKLPQIALKDLKRRRHAQIRMDPDGLVEKSLIETSGFIGQTGICTCGEPSCGSAYAWVEERVILLEMTTVVEYPEIIRILAGEIKF